MLLGYNRTLSRTPGVWPQPSPGFMMEKQILPTCTSGITCSALAGISQGSFLCLILSQGTRLFNGVDTLTKRDFVNFSIH